MCFHGGPRNSAMFRRVSFPITDDAPPPTAHDTLCFSHIRETMVNIMASPASQQPSDSMLSWVDQGHLDTSEGEDGASAALGGNQLPMDPPTCTFWCAVAMGALVKGSPVESVRRCTPVSYPARLLGSTSVESSCLRTQACCCTAQN